MTMHNQDEYLDRFYSLADVFSSATGLAAVVVDIHGNALSSCHHFNSFCSLMRAHEQYRTGCQQCEKYCAYEGLKESRPKILSCHAGLSLFSMPLIREGSLLGFIICGQVRAKYQEYKTIVIQDDRLWAQNAEINEAWRHVSIIDNNHLVASANLLNFIVNNITLTESKYSSTLESLCGETPFSYSELSRHERKLAAALRYIDENLYGELTLESVASQVCLSANYFSRFFKKQQGVNFKTWVNRKKMQRASELLRDPGHSIESIARKLQYAQTSYFCRVFRAVHQRSPQSFRYEQLSQ